MAKGYKSSLDFIVVLEVLRARKHKEIIRASGYDPEKILVKETMAELHRTVCVEPSEIRENEVKLLSNALKDMLRKELLGTTKTKDAHTVYGLSEINK